MVKSENLTTELQFWKVHMDIPNVKEEFIELEHAAEEELKPISETTRLKPW